MKRLRLVGTFTASFCFITVCVTSVHAGGVPGQGTWETTLQGRDLDGNTTTFEAYYDTVLDITWLADTILIASNSFGLPYNTDLGSHPSDSSGYMDNYILNNGAATWGGALHWLDAMNTANYGGANMWRLPTMIDIGSSGCPSYTYIGPECFNVSTTSGTPPYPANMIYSEMASMFYDTLGNLAYYDTSGNSGQSGWGLSNTGIFDNLQPNNYWAELDQVGALAWRFAFSGGQQYLGIKSDGYYAWAVHDGNVGAELVPVPLEILGDVTSDLASLLPSGNAKDDRRIGKALEHLYKAMNSSYWDDTDRINDHSVFMQLKKAIVALMKNENVDVTAYIQALVSAAAQIAITTIGDAELSGGDPKDIGRAWKEIGKAEAEEEDGNYDMAIEHYRKAWNHAKRAV